MKKFLLLIITVLGLTAPEIQVWGQERTRFLGVTAGFSPLQIKDYFHADYTYRGSGSGLQARYGVEGRKTQWQLEAAFLQASPQSIVSRKASTSFMDLGVNYLWRLSSATKSENRFQLFGGLGLRLFSTSTNYSPDIDVSTTVATAAVALGGTLKMEYRINAKQRIQVQGFAPVISTFYRPNYPFAGRDQITTSLVSQNAVYDGQLRYLYQITNRLQATLSYQINYFRFEQPRPIIGLRQTLGVGVQWTL